MLVVSMLSSAWWRAAHIVVVREAIVVMTCVVGAAVMVTFCVKMLEAVTVVEQGSMVCVSIKRPEMEWLRVPGPRFWRSRASYGRLGAAGTLRRVLPVVAAAARDALVG